MSRTEYKFRQIIGQESIDISTQGQQYLKCKYPEKCFNIVNSKDFWPIVVSELRLPDSSFVNGFLIHGDTPPLILNPDELPGYEDALVAYAFLLEGWIRKRGRSVPGSPIADISFPSIDMTREQENALIMRLVERKNYVLFHLLGELCVNVKSQEIKDRLLSRGLARAEQFSWVG